MKTPDSKVLLLIGSVGVIGLSGCGQVEQAANDEPEVTPAKDAAIAL